MMGDNRKLKILMLHGYRGNGEAFRERTGAFRKLVKKYCEFVFITAPNVIPPEEAASEEASNNLDERGWWFSTQDSRFYPHEFSNCIKGYEESLTVIKKAFKDHGPFDGVLGFSQGAALVSMLCGILQNIQDEDIKFNFAIIVAGFKSRSSQHDDLYADKLMLPTLHVYGETDKVIEKEMSVDLVNYFEDPAVLEHSGGHYIPATGAQKEAYSNFLQNMLKNKNADSESS